MRPFKKITEMIWAEIYKKLILSFDHAEPYPRCTYGVSGMEIEIRTLTYLR